MKGWDGVAAQQRKCSLWIHVQSALPLLLSWISDCLGVAGIVCLSPLACTHPHLRAAMCQEGPDLRVFSVWSSPGVMAIWRKVSFAPITLNRSCVVFPTAPHWTAYELGLILLEELESCSGQLVWDTLHDAWAPVHPQLDTRATHAALMCMYVCGFGSSRCLVTVAWGA